MISDVWSWQNWIDDAGTLVQSTSGAFGELVPANVQDPRVGKIFRAGGLATELRAEFAVERSIAVIGIFGVNLGEMVELQVRVGSGAGLGDVFTASATLPRPYGRQAVFLVRDLAGDLTPVNARHVAISASGTGPLECGRFWVGPANWSPTVSHAIGSTRGVVDLSTRAITPRSGASLIDRAARLRTFSAEYDAISAAEYAGAMVEIETQVGTSAQALFVPRPDVHDIDTQPILGYLREPPELTFTGFLRASRTLSIVECG